MVPILPTFRSARTIRFTESSAAPPPFNTARIDPLYEDPHNSDGRFILHHSDMTDSSSLMQVVQKVQPDEIYNLAAQSHVQVSFEEPEYTANSDALGVLCLIEAIRTLHLVD